MFNLIQKYTHWLHTNWPAGHVEKLPFANPDGSTSIPGVYLVGDITGIPLLKFSADTGANAVKTITADTAFQNRDTTAPQTLDLVIIGAGVAGVAAALEAKSANLNFQIIEATAPFSTITNFPKRKPIYTYPNDMIPAGKLQFTERSTVKEGLLDELTDCLAAAQIQPRIAHVEKIARQGKSLAVHITDAEPVKTHRVIVAIGRSGNFRKLDVPGENLDKVYNRLHDPKDFCDQNVLVVGGGDSALEAAIALAECGSRVTLSYRKPEFSRPKPGNIDKLRKLTADPNADVTIENPTSARVTTAVGPFIHEPHPTGNIRLMLPSTVKEITNEHVTVTNYDGNDEQIPNDAVFTMIGREAPLNFFRRSNIRIKGEWRINTFITLAISLAIFTFIYHWKKTGVWLPIGEIFQEKNWFPYNIPAWLSSLNQIFDNPANLLGTLKISLGEPGFFYSLAYTLIIIIFGYRRIKRRQTPYVTAQTLSLAAFQLIPLFLLPYILLPWLGHLGLFNSGPLATVADQLFPAATYTEHGREYWRAFGLILAWPLFIWNVFTDQPMNTWLVISLVQTFVIIPALIYRYGKGAYCGWICSCGALAETLGDSHRHKMPHGPIYNRLNMIGQIFLAVAFILLITRIIAWLFPGGFAGQAYNFILKDAPIINYVWFVDLLWAGILGVGLYFHFSGRVWCRFACPLAALMHIYARFSRFRILADKSKCISCNVCTSVCHQGIDIMNFANKGLPMEDPQCVRCSACVQSCPTAVLQFGQINRQTGQTIQTDKLSASPVQITINNS